MSAVLELVQGSESWHEHRAHHRNASDAPAMMGCSPYESRSQLLHRLHTGIAPEVDEATQRRFDIGHRSEALCRPLAEQLLEEDLAPRVATNGLLSASLDGCTLLCDIDWEHKQMSEALREALPAKGIGGPEVGAALPMLYRVQVAQQQHCSGARRTLFSSSLWTTEGELVEARHCWIDRDEALIASVLAGWKQLERDLAAYVPPEAAPVVVAAAQEHLPAVSVQVSGALAVVSNLAELAPRLRAYIERIPKNPSTDQEFADVDAAGKRLREVQATIEGKVRDALAGIADVNELQRLGGEMAEAARQAAIACEKAAASGKEAVKLREVQARQSAIAAHCAAANARLGGQYINMGGNFGGVIKGLKSIDSVRDKLDTELARAKIECDQLEHRIAANLATLAAAGPEHQALFADRGQLVHKDPEAVQAIVSQRVAEHRAAEDRRLAAERERIRIEEAAKAQAAAAAQVPAAQVAEAARPGGGTPPLGTPAPIVHRPSGQEPVVKLTDLCSMVGDGFSLTADWVRARGIPVHKTERTSEHRGALVIAAADVRRLRTMVVAGLARWEQFEPAAEVA